MQLRTEQDMDTFCEGASKYGTFRVNVSDLITDEQVSRVERVQDDLIREGVIPSKPISHLQQGIITIVPDLPSSICISETPYLFPNPKIMDRSELKDYFGAITGTLVNCYDPKTKEFLFHIRGKDVDTAWGFQAAAAGMGMFREPLNITAKRELAEEAGILYPRTLFDERAIDALPFMKGRIPQPLFSFGFTNDLSGFRRCESLDDITEFEAQIKQSIRSGRAPEAYHFKVPYLQVEKVTGEIKDQKRFYGPIYESVMNFLRALKDSGQLK